MDRRGFLKYLGKAGLACGTSGWLVDRLWALHQENRLPHNAGAPLERWVHTVCTQCPGGCGLRVRCYEGLPVQLAGNPVSPINRGGLCPLGSAGLQVLYHPDRIREPLTRTGERGENRWRPLTWNEAIGILQERLQKLRLKGEAHRMAFLDGGTQTTMGALTAQFMRAYGSPNHLRQDGNDPAQLAFQLTQGETGRIAYDLPNASSVLSFGFDLLEAEGAPVWQTLSYGNLREGQRAEQGVLIQVEPRMSITAAQADRWVPTRPGSEAALALGIAHILIREGLYNRDFVRRYTFGFENWKDASGTSHTGFRTLVLRDYAPETVSQLTGVPAEDIRQVARAFGSRSRALAIAGKGVTSHTNGLYTQLAVHALNALTGRIGRPGGLLTARPVPLAPLADFQPDATAQQGLRQPPLGVEGAGPLASSRLEAFLDRLGTGAPYSLDTLLVYQANPLFSNPEVQKVKQAFEQIPFVVSFASFMDETAACADLILPDHTDLERWGDVASVPGVAWGYAAIQQPAVPPLYQTRHTGNVLIQLAQALGDATASALPDPDFESLLRRRYRGLFESEKGRIAAPEGALPPPTFEAFWSKLLECGAWMESLHYGPPGFGTPSGKYEFYVQALRSAMADRSDEAFLPHLEPPRFNGDAIKYPYLLYVFDTNTLYGGKGALLPLTMEMVGFRHNILWDSWVEINPITAKQLDIRDGDPLWVQSEVGQVRTRARVWPGVPPDVVAIPIGLGHEAFGRYAKGRGVNPNRLRVSTRDGLSGAPARLATRVKIVNAG